MLGDLVEGLIHGYIASRSRPTRRGQLAARAIFGTLGLALSIAGTLVVPGRLATMNGPLRLSVLLVFASMGAFSLFNVMLARQWRWPGLLFVVSFVMVFVTRILLGP